MAPGPVLRKLACGGGARSGRKKEKILEAPWTWPRLRPPPLPSGCPSFSRTSWSLVSCLLRWGEPLSDPSS